MTFTENLPEIIGGGSIAAGTIVALIRRKFKVTGNGEMTVKVNQPIVTTATTTSAVQTTMVVPSDSTDALDIAQKALTLAVSAHDEVKAVRAELKSDRDSSAASVAELRAQLVLAASRERALADLLREERTARLSSDERVQELERLLTDAHAVTAQLRLELAAKA
ncbi:hypothetical protein [Gemmatimonas sp.]|uniref:hypothetical protein n=1 Tax=Gemmatimonas sp. TaxID=1962908 RepID=UPI0035624AFF